MEAKNQIYFKHVFKNLLLKVPEKISIPKISIRNAKIWVLKNKSFYVNIFKNLLSIYRKFEEFLWKNMLENLDLERN